MKNPVMEQLEDAKCPSGRGGRKGGRKPAVTPEKLARAKALMDQGLNVREAAARLKVGKTALYEALAAHQASMTASKNRAKERLGDKIDFFISRTEKMAKLTP